MSKFKHFCHEWDGLEIDETYPEFEVCICYPAEEVKEFKKELNNE